MGCLTFFYAWLLEFRGRARVRFGDAGGLEDVQGALCLAREIDDDLLRPAGVLVTWADCLIALGRPDDAVDYFLRAAAEYAETGVDVESGRAAWRAAVLLGAGGHMAEAREAFAMALERTVGDAELHEVIAEEERDTPGLHGGGSVA
jgi:tetratricopeptide (TPR) repeat protein